MSGVMGNDAVEMAENKYKLSLADIRKDIETSYKYFEKNFNTFRKFFTMTFDSTLSQADKDNLTLIGKPNIEFGIFEAFISRLRGEFSKQRPTINVHAAEGFMGKLDDSYLKLMKVSQAHIDEIFRQADSEGFSDDMYKDTIAGGFGVARMITEYVNEKSFMLRIKLEKADNPCLCGFDPLAKHRHKGDGRYCFELYPMSQDEFAAEFGEERAKTFNFTRAVESFNWTYTNEDIKVVLVADYYVKVPKNTTLVKIAKNMLEWPEAMTLTEYNKRVKEHEGIEQVPEILQKRTTTITRIDRYRVCQNEILDHEETFYPMLPLVFFDGNSAMIQEESGGQLRQKCKPYTYHALGAQRLFNFSGQTIGQELEDMPRNTYMVPVGAIPKSYIRQWQYPQIAGTLAYHQFDLDKPDVRYDPPQVVQRMPTPPLVQETFVGSQNIIQQVLGSYDAVLGINGNDISGKAIEKGAMQSDAAAMPYYTNFIMSLQRCAEIILHLMPLIYTTPRTIPIRLPNGKRDYQVINEEYPKVDKQKEMLQKAQEMGMGGMNTQIEEEGNEDAESEEMEEAVMFDYDPHDLNIMVEPGVNTHVQKQLSFELLTRAMEVSPTLAEFFNRQGLPVILESLDLPGIEMLKSMVEQFQAQMAKEREEQASQPQEVDKIIQAEIQKSQLESEARMQKIEADFAIAIAKLAEQQEETELKRQELELKAKEAHIRLDMERENQAAAATAQTIEMAIDVMKHQGEQDMQQQQMEQQQAQQTQGEGL
jgi:hypothetical protein